MTDTLDRFFEQVTGDVERADLTGASHQGTLPSDKTDVAEPPHAETARPPTKEPGRALEEVDLVE